MSTDNESIYDADPKPAYHELCDSPECRKCREWRDGGTDRATPECNCGEPECDCGEPECGNCAAQARALTRRSLEAEARANTEWAARMIALEEGWRK